MPNPNRPRYNSYFKVTIIIMLHEVKENTLEMNDIMNTLEMKPYWGKDLRHVS